jgi:hypothetical protein
MDSNIFFLPNLVMGKHAIYIHFHQHFGEETKFLLEKKAFMTTVTNIIITEYRISYLRCNKKKISPAVTQH